VLEQEHNGKALMDLLAERIAKEALSGKHPFVKEVLDRLEGPVNQKHDVNHSDEVRIVVEDVHGNERICRSMRELYESYPAPVPPDFQKPTEHSP
jgi:hypothetical protein